MSPEPVETKSSQKLEKIARFVLKLDKNPDILKS